MAVARIDTDTWGKGVNEQPVVLVIEDEYPVQDILEDALTEGGFAADILSSGEEALTLFRGRLKNYKALVTDVALKPVERLGGRGADQGNGPRISCRLYERRARRRMGVKRRSEQHYAHQAFRSRSACYRRFATAKQRPANNDVTPLRPAPLCECQIVRPQSRGKQN